MKRKLIGAGLVLSILSSLLAIAPVSAHNPQIINDVCDDSGYEMTGVALIDNAGALNPRYVIELCLKRDSSGDVDIAAADFTGTATIYLNQQVVHLPAGQTWQDRANQIWTKDFYTCKTTKSSGGTTYARRITRVRVQNSVFGVWDTIYDLQGPVGGDYSYTFSPIPDTADRLLIQVNAC